MSQRRRSALSTSPAAPPLAQPSASNARVAVLLAGLCFVVYLTNVRPMGKGDTIPARLLPFSILREGNLDLNEFRWLTDVQPIPYFLSCRPDGRCFSRYAVALPLLITPIAAPALWWVHAHGIADDDVRFRLMTVVVERLSAALIAAASVGCVFLGLCNVTSIRLATWMTLAYGLGTSTWGIGSQALWQHGLAELALAVTSMFLLRADTPRNAFAAGVFGALAVLARPTMVLFAFVAFVFMLRERRHHLWAFLGIPIIGGSLFAVYNARFTSLLSGGYGAVAFVWPRVSSFAGLLISPSRGLLVYSPALALALPTLVRPQATVAPWIRYVRFGVVGYLVLYSAWPGWWGGHVYGPRFLTDALPALVLCATPTVERLWRYTTGRCLMLVLVVWGVAVQAIGVYCDDNGWNRFPGNVDDHSQRVWDWFDPQIARAARAGWHGTDQLALLQQALTDARPALLKVMGKEELTATISIEDPLPLHFRPGASGTISMRVTNNGDAVWPAYTDWGLMECKLAHIWKAGDTVSHRDPFTPLPRNLGPGESAVVQARLTAPAHPGKYELESVLLQAIDYDRGGFGSPPLRIPVEVE